MEDDELEWEYSASFGGYCTCGHEPEDHGWGTCGADNEDGPCDCEAGWEE